jgi:hypothetical protein
MKLRSTAILGALGTLFLSCAPPVGTNFKRSALIDLKLGITSKSEFVEKIGPSGNESIMSITKDSSGNPIQSTLIVSVIKYYYRDSSLEAVGKNITANKIATAYFSNDRLLAYTSQSNFKSDSSDFDYKLAEKIVREKSTKQEVLNLLGPPSGAGLYPFAKEQNGYVLFYSFSFLSDSNRQWLEKTMAIDFQGNGTVCDIKLNMKQSPK